MARVAVTSRSFSKHPILRKEILSFFDEVTFNDEGKSLKGDDLVSFLAGHERAIIALEKIDAEILTKVPELRFVSKFGVGIDNFDVDALKSHGVKLSWTGGTNKRSVSELALCLILSLLRNVPMLAGDVKSGKFSQLKGQCLSGKTVGVVGCGFIGRDFIELIKPFGCKVLGFDPVQNDDFNTRFEVEPASIDKVFRESDIITLHLPLNPGTRNLVDNKLLSSMKPSAYLVNVSRGGIVDESALCAALKEKRIAGAAFDVFATEPPENLDLINLPNFIATPHIGGSTEEAILAMGRAAIAGLRE